MEEDTFRLDMVDIIDITGLERLFDRYANAVAVVVCEQNEQRSFVFVLEGRVRVGKRAKGS